MAVATCTECQSDRDLADGASICTACSVPAMMAPPGFGMAEATSADRGKVWSIVAIVFSALGMAVLPGGGAVGLVLGTITLLRGTAPRSTWRTLAIVAIAIGAASIVLMGAAWYAFDAWARATSD